jgi:DNA-binding HxlR family transcriptional regulator
MSEPDQCTITDLFHALSGRWTLPVLYQLSTAEAPLRFGELRRQVGEVTTSELTRTLRNLVSMGLVQRTQFPEIPVRVEYQVTPPGASLRPPLESLNAWLLDHQAESKMIKSKRGFKL